MKFLVDLGDIDDAEVTPDMVAQAIGETIATLPLTDKNGNSAGTLYLGGSTVTCVEE
jgi:hypothetical protein